MIHNNGNKHNRARNQAPVPKLLVARTLAQPQPKVDTFLNQIGAVIGMRGSVISAGSAHMTYLESTGVTTQFRKQGYTGRDVKRFSALLQNELGKAESSPRPDLTVQIDGDKPLCWVGDDDLTLALNVVPSERVLDEWDVIDSFVYQRLGDDYVGKPRKPHISIGSVQPHTLSRREQRDPNVLLTQDVDYPVDVIHSAALNGLVVYLNRIPGTQV